MASTNRKGKGENKKNVSVVILADYGVLNSDMWPEQDGNYLRAKKVLKMYVKDLVLIIGQFKCI
jgi:hypothetical protein